MIRTGMQVTKIGDSTINPDLGTVKAVSGGRAQVDWGWVVGWETVRSLEPLTPAASDCVPTPKAVRCDECGRPVPDAICIPAYCGNC